jgi:dissimilatory sulfite reductase (desulfoviridin) alpha/beta subunit
LEYNKLNANTGERFGDMLERTGFEKIEEALKITKSIT